MAELPSQKWRNGVDAGDRADDILFFNVEWFDPTAQQIKRFILRSYADDTIDLSAVTKRELFLKRSKIPNLERSDLLVGAQVMINSRYMNITGYSDDGTARKVNASQETTFGLLMPDVIDHMGVILGIITNNGLKISKLKMVQLTKKHVLELFPEVEGTQSSVALVQYLLSGPVLAVQLRGPNAVATWRAIVGPTDPAVARMESPQSLRARYGANYEKNAVYAAEDARHAEMESASIFLSEHRPPSSATLSNCTLCLIKPHAVKEGLAGDIISHIQAKGFQVTAAETFQLSKVAAEEFFNVYRTVLKDYSETVDEICSGISVALEITRAGSDIINEFREFVGPHDPDMAKALRPASLRAKFGTTAVRNAVHCTDLPTDGVPDCMFFVKYRH